MDDPDAFDVVAGCFSILLKNDKFFEDQPRYIEGRVLQDLSRLRPSLRIVWEESAYRSLKEVVRAFSDSPGNGKAYLPSIFSYSQRGALGASAKSPHFKLSSDVHKLWFASYDRDNFAEHLRDVLLRGKRSLERQVKKAKKELERCAAEEDAGAWGAGEWAEGGWDGADANAWEGDWGAPEPASAAAASPSWAEKKEKKAAAPAAPAEKDSTQRRQRSEYGAANDWGGGDGADANAWEGDWSAPEAASAAANDWGAIGNNWCQPDDWGSSYRAPAQSVAATERKGAKGKGKASSPSAAASPSPAVLSGESGSGKGGSKQVKGNKLRQIAQQEEFL